MVVAFEVIYHELVVKEDIQKLSKANKERIKIAIEEKLFERPEVFGKPLRNSLRGYRKLRVGDYRVVFRIKAQTVKIFYIAHRSIVYKMAERI